MLSFGMYLCLFLALYFEVFLLITFLEKRPRVHTATHSQSEYPTVCIFVPCWNEEKTIAGTLESLIALNYPQEKLSILVVDDGSTDTTALIAKAFASKHPQIKYLYKKNGGKFTALNIGIAHTQSELVACLDADSFVSKDSLREMVHALQKDPSIMAAAPVVSVHQPRTALELMQSVEYTLGNFYKKMFDNLSAIMVLPGPLPVYRREIFSRVGPFRHAHNTEDLEMTLRMHAHGLKIVNVHNAAVYTTVPTTLRKLIKQRARWSKGFLKNALDYSFMFFNPRFGNFGMLVLPSAIIFFAAALYLAGYALYTVIASLAQRFYDLWITGIPLHFPHFRWNWLDLHFSMMLFLVVASCVLLVTMMILGQRIAGNTLSSKSYLSYFALFSFVAPIWLARAAVSTLLARDSNWR